MLNIFIGYDDREAVAYHVCSNSIIRHASQPVSIAPLALNLMQGYSDGKRELMEGYPATNQFIFSRFLVPSLMGFKGWALFMDGDMILLDDIANLFEQRNADYAVMVVPHDYKTDYPVKYLNQTNLDYPRKNWSSVMLFNCGHPDNAVLTQEYVEQAKGSHLHRLEWTNNVGFLPHSWNWLPDEYGPNKKAKLLHYTAGTPCFHDYAETPMADLWHKERMLMNYSKQV